ncbi:MAG: CvpA family protein [Phycisphaerales bacterium]|nr:CvpA family protein [Phycisphaerales bacterium]
MMQVFMILIWAIAALMGCWSFSLFMRWLSETLANKRTHLQARRSARAQWLGFVLVFVCLGVALFAGWMGLYIEKQYSWGKSGWITPAGVIGGSVSLFALLLIIWATIGDRPRGRIRCPKCWYDMSAAVGLRCPECGHEVKDQAGFSKSRRPRWAYFVAALLLVAGTFGMSVSRDVAEYGPLGVVPTWVLMAGWEVLPDDWIGADWDTSIDGCLRERLSDDRISRSRMRRFGNRLCAPLIDDLDARTDPKRIILLRVLNYDITSVLDTSTDTYAWADPPVDIEALLRLTMVDAIDALTAENPTPAQSATIDAYADVSFIAADWLFRRESESGQLGEDAVFFSPEFYALTTEIIGVMPPELHTEQFGRNLIHRSYARQNLAWSVSTLTGVYDTHFDSYFNTESNPEQTKLWNRVRNLMRIYPDLPYEEQVPILKRLIDYAKSESASQRAFALYAAEWLGSLNIFYTRSGTQSYRGTYAYSENQETSSAFEQLKLVILDEAVGDHRVANPDKVRNQRTIHHLALSALNAISPGDTRIYTLFRNSLLAGNDTPTTNVDSLDDELIQDAIENWIEQFGDLRDHESASVRKWFEDNLPSSVDDDDLLP